jgi:hypothetical protein
MSKAKKKTNDTPDKYANAVRELVSAITPNVPLPTDEEIVGIGDDIKKIGNAQLTELAAQGDTAEIIQRITDIILKQRKAQGELSPLFTPLKSVELKKEFALNFGSIDRIEKEHKELLKVKLTSGKTLQRHLDEVKNWFNDLRGEDLGNWIKLFAFVKSIRDFKESSDEDKTVSNIVDMGNGRYCFRIRTTKAFFSAFIRPDRKSGQFTTKAKDKFLRWLYANQRTITFPIICDGQVWTFPTAIYTYAENIAADGKKEIFFSVDTNVLESTFKDYVSIDTTEIDNIDELWKGIADSNPIFNRLRLNNFMDTPLKFLLTLKTIYNRDGNYARGHFIGNQQTLTREHLDTHLGELTQRIQKHLAGHGTIKANKGEAKVKEIKHLVLETIFAIAKERRWLLTDPKYEDGRYTFNLNAGYFDRRAIARRLKDDGQRAGKNPP